MTLSSSDLQSDSDLDSIRNSCDVFVAAWIHLKVGIDYLQEIKESGTCKKCWAGRKPQIAAARVTWAGLIMPTSTLLMTSACFMCTKYTLYRICSLYRIPYSWLQLALSTLYRICTYFVQNTLLMTWACSMFFVQNITSQRCTWLVAALLMISALQVTCSEYYLPSPTLQNADD